MLKYIAFEGIDYSGKSKQVSLLGEWLTRHNCTPITLVEPTYGRYGKCIRRHMITRRSLSTNTQIELFTKDREEHVKWKIKPLLEFVRNYTSFLIVQDRCYLSAPAYQAESETSMIALVQKQRTIAPPPDIVFLIDVPVAVALARQESSGEDASLFEKGEILQRVRDNYLLLTRILNERIEIIDGCGPPDLVNRRITTVLTKELNQNGEK